MKRMVLLLALVLLIMVAAGWYVFRKNEMASQSPQADRIGTDEQTPAEPQKAAGTGTFDTTQYSLEDPASIWIVVNKRRPIPTSFMPDVTVPPVRLRLAASHEQMRVSTSAVAAIEELFAAARRDGVELVFGSGYRSAALQSTFYNGYVASMGRNEADRTSARPGHSEHQTGLAVDITSPSGACHLEKCFEDLPQGQWLKQNAHLYGFIIRYENGKETITGYDYEPWHIRYVGKELAGELHRTGLTLEEFFELGSAPDYSD